MPNTIGSNLFFLCLKIKTTPAQGRHLAVNHSTLDRRSKPRHRDPKVTLALTKIRTYNHHSHTKPALTNHNPPQVIQNFQFKHTKIIAIVYYPATILSSRNMLVKFLFLTGGTTMRIKSLLTLALSLGILANTIFCPTQNHPPGQ